MLYENKAFCVLQPVVYYSSKNQSLKKTSKSDIKTRKLVLWHVNCNFEADSQKKMFKKILLLCCLMSVAISNSFAQITYNPYSYQHYNTYGSKVYGDSLVKHTAVKPYISSPIDGNPIIEESDSSQNWFIRKIFKEHLVEVKKEDHSFYLDFMPDMLIGKQFGSVSKNLWTNTRGMQLGLSIKDKFTLYTNFFENQAIPASYIYQMANTNKAVPGQGTYKYYQKDGLDWMNATANMTYALNPALQLSLAYDKIHIGEGYRSMLLSDNSFNFSHAKVSGEFGKLQYNSIWAFMNDRMNPKSEDIENPETKRLGDGVKYGAFQYIDYNFLENFSAGVFLSNIWTSLGETSDRKINSNYGLNLKYLPVKQLVLYGQLLADDADFKRMGYQLGAKTFDLFAVSRLNLTLEYNQATPYTYQSSNNRVNYSNHGEALAHPRGANFKELVGIATYKWRRFDIYLQGLYSKYGQDPTNDANFGGNIFKQQMPENPSFSTGQGQAVNLVYLESRLAYIINPKYNLRIELGMIRRQQKIADLGNLNNSIISFGLRSSFRQFYTDY